MNKIDILRKNYYSKRWLENIIEKYESIPMIRVGFPSTLNGAAGKYPTEKKRFGKKIKNRHFSQKQDTPNVIEVAIWNNFGTDRIPARPFFTIATKKIGIELEKVKRDLMKRISSDELDLKQACRMLGNLGVSIIKKEIINLRTPPNAPETIKAKGSSNPLIDTSHMLNSVTYEVKNREELF